MDNCVPRRTTPPSGVRSPGESTERGFPDAVVAHDANAITAQYFQVKPLSSVRPAKAWVRPGFQRRLLEASPSSGPPPRAPGAAPARLGCDGAPKGTNSPFVPSAPSLDALADPNRLG